MDNKTKIIRQYFLYFLMYSIIGWIYEVFLEVAIYRWGFSNRGVLFGPYCIIYGFGALVLILSLTPLKNSRLKLGPVPIALVLVFIGIVVISTAVELIGSYIMEMTTGGWMWDYTRFSLNFQGRIALNPSLRFGVGGMTFLYIFQPLFERLTDRMSNRVLNAVSSVAAVIFFADVFYTFVL